MNFNQLGLSEKTIKAIDEVGVSNPTTVQCNVIPSILEGKDVFAIAPQGCGKTCSYVFPLIDIISRKNGQNILIVTPDSTQSVIVSDQFAIFNKYHEIDENGQEIEENLENDANVIIGAPDILLDIAQSGNIDFEKVNVLVVDDINLLKRNKQLANLETILDKLSAKRQNIVYTNRRSKETQYILDKILNSPQEIKVDKTKEKEAEMIAKNQTEKQNKSGILLPKFDKYAQELDKKYQAFKHKTPNFVLYQADLAENTD